MTDSSDVTVERLAERLSTALVVRHNLTFTTPPALPPVAPPRLGVSPL